MGHDLYAYKGNVAGKEDQGGAVADLSRGAFNQLGREIYKALGATDCDCGCSGCGEDRHFTLDGLKAALAKLPPGVDLEPERAFLLDCISQGDDGVTIGFY